MNNYRLEAIIDLISKTDSLIDIGTDHAYLPIAIKTKWPECKVGASDVKKGPLEIAKKNIGNLDIALIQSDGLSQITEVYHTVVMAGMGGYLMSCILEKGKDYLLRNCTQLVLQPNRDADLVRQWIYDNYGHICRETIVKDYKYYQIIVACPPKEPYEKDDVLFGPLLRKERTPIFDEYYHQKDQELRNILKTLDSNNKDYEKLVTYLEAIKKTIKP